MKRVQKLISAAVVAAVFVATVAGCAQPINKTTQSAAIGAGLGAGLGAIVGSQSGRAGPGIAIGAAAGALAGGVYGNQLDQGDERNRQVEGQLNRQGEQISENQRLIDELRSRGADVRDSRRGVVVNLPDILFEYDRDALTPEAVRTVGEISDVLREVRDRRISIEGHTDSYGSMEYNQNLSRRRAESVSRRLEREGVSSGQMSTRGYGETTPIATNNNAEGRARNRRVEIIIENR